ncbi:hypothetical protein UPYG_G00315390 [Umbra pygmaea]|uniref:Mitogen-activated protein kinase kinase kinase 19 n=1 Tax=Umbra pygmaea TaxID=75934 RepID=A0ABD0WJQ9_UMBPY
MERGQEADVEVLRVELEEVGLGLDQLGDCSWEEVDVPHNDKGSTPLITACQRGLTQVVHFLLRKGADMTLCNHSNQTALHVSPTVLQEVLLSANYRHLPHRTLLLQAAWQGDLHSLQKHLAQTDLVDVNVQNRDGLTPLMLAVRDIDLFEGLVGRLPWEHKPVEVVRELLTLSADLGVCDVNGCSALHHAAQIQSPIKNELILIMLESIRQPVPTPLDFQCFHPDELRLTFPGPSTSPAPGLIHSADTSEDAVETSECVLLLDRHEAISQNKRLSLCFQSTMDTLRDMRQAYQNPEKGGSQGSSLPSLWNRGRQLGKLDPVPGMSKTAGSSGCLPVPSRPRGSSEAVAHHPALLSQSAPTLMEAVLDSNSLVQARVHIQNRLGCGGTEKISYGPNGNFHVLHPGPVRNPKMLAPLDGRHRDGGVLTSLKHPSPLKPISLGPLSSMPSSTSKLRRQRVSRTIVSPREAPATRGQSEDSSSSSTSSPSSIDLEEDEDHKDEDIEETTENQHVRENFEGTLHLDLQTLDSTHKSIVEIRHQHTTNLLNVKDVKNSSSFEMNCENEVVEPTKTMCSGVLCLSKGTTNTEPNTACTSAPGINRNQESQVDVNNTNKTFVDNTKYQCLPSTTIVTLCKLNAHTDEKIKAFKQPKIRERKCSTGVQNKTNHSFNVLAQKDPIRKSKSKRNIRTSSIPSQVKANIRKPPDLIIGGDITVKSRIISTKTIPKNTDCLRDKGASSPSHKRHLNDKNTKINAPCQKLIHEREPKSARQPKKTGGIQGSPRAKSAVDSITYNDIFQEINIGVDQGPVIYEMFAGPMFDNIRFSRSSERSMQVQSAPCRNNQTPRLKNKCPKVLQSGGQRRSSVDKVASTKGKLRKSKTVKPLSRGKSPLTPIPNTSDQDNVMVIPGLNWQIHTQSNPELILNGNGEETVLLEENHMLSVIEEVLSCHASETLIPRYRSDGKTSPSQTKPELTPQSDPDDDDSLYVQRNGALIGNNILEAGCNNEMENHVDHSCTPSYTPVQPMINTWTSGTGESRATSPVFQTFLDRVGEGPLTDDLLRCLAEELISLDERDSLSPSPENNSDSDKRREFRNNYVQLCDKPSKKANIPSGGVHSRSDLVLDDAISWTKGEVLGRGAYGTVFCGLTSKGQLIAVKQVSIDTSNINTANTEYNRLQQEVDLLKTLHHCNIVGFLGTSLQDNVVNIFMEYVPGGSIASVLHRFGPLPERVLALYTRQILEGVSYLHLNRVIHRDLKGNNLMLMPTGVIKLIDFGCARRLSCHSHTNSRSDLLKSVHGTPYWMAPEVINETGHGRKSDIWSVGCTMFEMATGKPPLSHMNKMAALFYIGARRGLMPSLPDGFTENAKDFVQVCLTSDKTQRPTAEQLLEHPFILKDKDIFRANIQNL